MSDSNSTSIWIGAITGGLAGAVVTLCVQKVLEDLRIWRLSKNLVLTPEATPHGCRIRVTNSGVQTIEDAIAYISLKFNSQTDVLDGPAFIGPHNRMELRDDRLCWAVAAPEPHPYRISIFPGEKQVLDLVGIHSDKIEIPSEQGWGSCEPGKCSRVFLKRQRYQGTINLVAKNTLRRNFSLVIDPNNTTNLVTLSPLEFMSFSKVLFCGKITDKNAV